MNVIIHTAYKAYPHLVQYKDDIELLGGRIVDDNIFFGGTQDGPAYSRAGFESFMKKLSIMLDEGAIEEIQASFVMEAKRTDDITDRFHEDRIKFGAPACSHGEAIFQTALLPVEDDSTLRKKFRLD